MLLPHHHTTRVRILRTQPAGEMERADVVAVEEPLEIRLRQRDAGTRREHSIAVTMRTPGHDFELAAGFLYSEGIVRERADIERITYCEGTAPQEYNIVNVDLRPGMTFDEARLLRHFYITSSCGVCGKASLEALEVQGCTSLPAGEPLVDAGVIQSLPSALHDAQTDFQRTGGVHAAALFDHAGRLVCLREDVGRHNAVDKVVGERLLEGALPLSGHIMMVSGRTSFEILQKSLVAQVPIVISVGAPSSLAVDLARNFGMTLVGFTSDEGFNVYADSGRIVRG
ncbi:MAG: formate dehydrogenase accessory sulfurtransferase FdhD [Gemmatimonadetes bacterium]|nr:formate dehydrogenase accessory sulfurtransferase FdhD [Gemmatimonadota bacterium]